MTGDAGDILIRTIGRTGRITLNRPGALNALTYDMAQRLDRALADWAGSGAVDCVTIDAVGDRAFCAGGDITELYRRARGGDVAFGQRFWADEYRMNARIAGYPLPYLAVMDGIVMGGGVGVSAHGSHRIVTERSLVAMPECGIGLVPDVGGSWLLARAPGHLGEFLAVTGWRMGPADAIHAGLADMMVPSQALAGLVDHVERRAEPDFARSLAADPGPSAIAARSADIDRHFAGPTVADCLASLEADGSDFAARAAAMARAGCPLSVACAFEIVRRARAMDRIEQALALEYRFTFRSMTMGDLLEGIRAQVIDKDRAPKWSIGRIEDVTAEAVAAMLAPLDEDELQLTETVS